MGVAVINSKFPLLALIGLISFSFYGQTSFAFAQEDFQLEYDAFHQPSSILADDKLIFFNPANHDSTSSISVQGIKTGSLFEIQSPHKSLDDDWFGQHMSLVGNNIAASSNFLDPQTDKWTTMVHVFDVKTGNLLYSIENPISDSMYFGYTLKSIEDKLAVYATDDDPNDDIHDNVVHVFDGKDGSLLYTIGNPLDIGHFGRSISTIDNIFLIHTRQDTSSNLSGTIHAFDADTGNLQYTIESPQKDIKDVDPYFGGQSIISGDYVIVKSGDAVYVFDGNTGELRKTADGPVTTNNQLHAILDSIGDDEDDGYGDSFFILVAMVVVIGIVALGIVLFKKTKR